MGNSQTMPVVDFKEEKLKTAFMYSKYLESKNLQRSAIARKLLIRNRILFTASAGLAVAIYSYTLYKVKQETFLDDFEEPPRIIKEN